MTNNICPKCREPYDDKMFFGHVDHEGVIAACMHGKDYVEIGTVFGLRLVRTYERRCYLTVDEAKHIYDFRQVTDDIYELV